MLTIEVLTKQLEAKVGLKAQNAKKALNSKMSQAP